MEENRSIIKRWIEAFNNRNLAVLDELVSPDFFHHTWHLQGPEGMKQFYAMTFKGFPDLHETIDDIVAEGDKVWHHFTTTGTHAGEFRGLAPTGKKVTWSGVNFWRIVKGKVVEKGSIYDMLNTLEQLGVIKYTDKAKGFLP